MSSVTKENEVLTAIPENAARPQPVALEVAVTVNGARTVAGSDKREPFSESTKTVLIFGHGAVMRLSSSVAPGQLLFLTNEKTKKEVVCQVVNSKNYSSVSGYVELEFTEPVSGFWGMRFPAAPQGHGSEPTPASSPTARNLAIGSVLEPKAPVATTTAAIQPETKSTTPSSPRVSQSVPSSSAVSLNQPSSPQPSAPNLSPASLNAIPSSITSADPLETSKPTKTPTPPLPVTPKISTVPSKSILDSDEIKIPSWLEPLARNAAAASAALPEIKAPEPVEDFGNIPVLDDLAVTEITDTPEGANRGVPSSSFGTHFLAEEHDGLSEDASASGKSSKKFLIGAIAAGGLLLVGAGGWYMRQSSDNAAANNSAPNSAAVSTAAPSTTNNSVTGSDRTQSQPQVRTSTPDRPTAKLTSVSTPATIAPEASAGAKSAKFVDANRTSLSAGKNIATVDSASDPAPAADVTAPAPPRKQNLGSVKLSAPIMNKASEPVPAEEALNLEPSQPAAGFAPGLVGSASRQPVAPSSGPDIKNAALISSVAPVYPMLAKTQRITGAVTIDALIDVTGRVASMTVVSGPALLQDAAKDALRRWKYAPAELHGKPVPMHMTVTIQFKLQ